MTELASPQLEEGYTRLANELLDAMLRAGFTSRQWAVVMAIVRKTYGYNKKSDDIGLGQLATMTGIDKAHLSRTVRELASSGVLNRKVGTFGHSLSVNKNYAKWKLTGPVKRNGEGLPKEQRRLPNQQPVNGVAETATWVAERATGEGVALLASGVADSATVALSAKLGLPKEQPQKTTLQKKENLLSGKPDPSPGKLRLDEQSKAAIDYLNKTCDTAYRHVESNVKLARARLKEGASLDEIKQVIDAKAKEWKGTNQARYLRPETLFNATKFAQYVGLLTAPVLQASGERVDLGNGRHRIGNRFFGADGKPEVVL